MPNGGRDTDTIDVKELLPDMAKEVLRLDADAGLPGPAPDEKKLHAYYRTAAPLLARELLSQAKRAKAYRTCSCGMRWRPAGGLFGTTEETECPACVLRQMLASRDDDIAQFRATVTRLNRRCQVLEAGIAEKVNSHPNALSLGRALANAAASMYEAKTRQLHAALRILYRGYVDAPDECPEGELTSFRTTPQALQLVTGVLDQYKPPDDGEPTGG